MSRKLLCEKDLYELGIIYQAKNIEATPRCLLKESIPQWMQKFFKLNVCSPENVREFSFNQNNRRPLSDYCPFRLKRNMIIRDTLRFVSCHCDTKCSRSRYNSSNFVEGNCHSIISPSQPRSYYISCLKCQIPRYIQYIRRHTTLVSFLK